MTQWLGPAAMAWWCSRKQGTCGSSGGCRSNSPPRVLPLWLNGQVAAVSAAGNVVAAALPDANKVVTLIAD